MHQLSKFSKWLQLGECTSGSSNFTGDEVDLANAAGAAFQCWVGTTYAGAVTLKIQGAASTTGTFQDLLGATKSTTAGADCAVVDVYRPKFRWLRPVVTAVDPACFMVSGEIYGANVNPQSSTNYTAVVGVGT